MPMPWSRVHGHSLPGPWAPLPLTHPSLATGLRPTFQALPPTEGKSGEAAGRTTRGSEGLQGRAARGHRRAGSLQGRRGSPLCFSSLSRLTPSGEC